MNESFLHYVWQFQYFEKSGLQTTDGDEVTIFNPGNRNTHAGPDFQNARIRIGSIDWVGNAEIHIHSSGWTDHKHDTDNAYDNVILHVVWSEDKKIKGRDGSMLPTIELKKRVAEQLLLQYKKLVNRPEKIPCASFLEKVSPIKKLSMIERALTERLEAKALLIKASLKQNNNDWDETAYQMLGRNFGFKVNSEPFERLVKNLPYKYLLKHADQQHQVEALLFGQAGFLEDKCSDEYFLLLIREYTLLAKKYSLKDNKLNKAQWRFLRLRPANFPTLRIAQFASLLCGHKNIFSRIISSATYSDTLKMFSVSQSSYWTTHYQFSKVNTEGVASLGKASVDKIIVNTVFPLIVAYGKFKDDQAYVDRAIDMLQNIDSEDNTIIRGWSEVGVDSKSAADSQGLIELHNNFCLKRRCLDCNIGFTILQPVS
jgi:hypothetical protein